LKTIKSLCPAEKTAVEIFFADPVNINIVDGKKSHLYMVRLNARICLSKNGTNHEEAVWAATMVVFSGIDLLGQCYNGLKSDVGSRFIKFCKMFLNLDDDQSIALYHVDSSSKCN